MVPAGLQILRTNLSGMPIEWLSYQEAVKLYCLDQVAAGLSGTVLKIRGGINARNGRRSVIEIHSIIATYTREDWVRRLADQYVPPLTNRALFKRDDHICLYCGGRFPARELSRDHVTPLSRGGTDTWNNVVTACKRCNHFKAGRTPEEAGMELLAIPYVPTYAEYIYLQGRRILEDQMEFLKHHFPRQSPIRARLERLLH